MSQRFTVSKSDGERNPSEMQGEVNQLFEGDDPPTCSAAEEEKEVAAGGGADEEEEDVVVVLKGKQTHTCRHHPPPCLLAVSYPASMCGCLTSFTSHRLWRDVTGIFNAFF